MAKEGTREHLLRTIKRVSRQHQSAEPVAFLASIAAGVDPRRKRTDLQQRLDAIELIYSEEVPDQDDWEDFVEYLRREFKDHSGEISLSMSTHAAEKLLEFTNAKRKSIDASEDDAATMGKPTKLTPTEARAFNENFKRDY